MTIVLLQDYAPGDERFEKGDVVEGRSDASEAHFVRRGKAAYLKGGQLLDIDGNVIGQHKAKKGKAAKAGDGGQKDDDQKGDDQKDDDQKGDDQKGDDQKGGDQKDGDQKDGDQKDDDQKPDASTVLSGVDLKVKA